MYTPVILTITILLVLQYAWLQKRYCTKEILLYYIIILLYLVGPIILIYNLDILKNATLSILLGEGLREGEVIYLIDLNLLQ